ncbi:hypothetical protein MHU86_24040 [Fragilaria crotonensis]|nr:hypothetical protein MHU86_24040 [Fragilaria crotonensis]
MSAPRELNHPDDFVILTVDVADSPIAELRLSEIYDVETSSMNDDYLHVLQDYVALQLKATFGLNDGFKFRLLGSRFIPLHCRENGDVVSLRKPALERLIRQILQSRLDVQSSLCFNPHQFKTQVSGFHDVCMSLLASRQRFVEWQGTTARSLLYRRLSRRTPNMFAPFCYGILLQEIHRLLVAFH